MINRDSSITEKNKKINRWKKKKQGTLTVNFKNLKN